MTETTNLRVVFVGHVDHGKSTIVGRLLADTNSIPVDKVEKVRKRCLAQGKPFEHAFLLDALEEEQDQGITIDIVKLYFKTESSNFTIIDAPGHKEFLKNMISGASQADAAILIVDAKEGIREQTKRHGYILSLLGISQVIVAVNKMDLVQYSQETFEEIKSELDAFLQLLNVRPVCYVPISGRDGENVVSGAALMPWFKGKSLIKTMDELEPKKNDINSSLRLCVQDVYKFDERRIVAGRIESGALKVGDEIYISPSGKKTSVKSIETWKAEKKVSALAGESVGITLEDELFIERGNIISDMARIPMCGNIFETSIFWLGQEKLKVGEKYILRLATQECEAEVYMIKKSLNSSSLEIKKKPDYLSLHDVAEVVIKCNKSLVFDNFSQNASLGRFVLVKDHVVQGGGIVTQSKELENRSIDEHRKAAPISTKKNSVTFSERKAKLDFIPKVFWITGEQGSGRNSIARGIERRLFESGYNVFLLTGAHLRFGLSSDLDFSKGDKHEQARRLAETAKLMHQAGVIVIVSTVSPYRKDREYARRLIGENYFVEVHVDCREEIRSERYKKIKSYEYELPQSPELMIDSSDMSPTKCVDVAYEHLITEIK